MPRLTSASGNVRAFLDMLAWSEIGPGLLEHSDAGYDVLVGSTPRVPLLFTSYATHPNIYNRRTNSTAAGRYQILARYWPHYRELLKLPDFGPVSQDLYAIQQLRERKALPLIESGHITAAIAMVSNIWASLPGAGYGQHEHEVKNLLAVYKAAGGDVA
ncbi:glycoside hydrolase [Rhodanobacter glycinis]|uniref:Glycoside hydrolase n=1 Tax=Rhodanobacter glycinis TaxID=582702 RepID=A0A502C6A5_9GAMM|nr:glycoside hydrolase family 104 protein [Rhodanobacter glycinis]TPG08332.1 glycoside hydrolase [Rhodanobacter glycinis]